MSPAAPDVRRYRIRHVTRYGYGGTVMHSHQLLHLVPRAMPFQRTISHRVDVDPEPAFRSDSLDAFGNPVTRLQIDRPHTSLTVDARLDIEVSDRPERPPGDSQPWEEVADSLRYDARSLSQDELDLRRYRFESPYVRIKQGFEAYARDCFPARRPVLEGSIALMRRIHTEFTYAPGETQIATPLVDVLRDKRGVCQDYAHFMIACLRSIGLAARYVSGYLRTEPATGGAKPGLVGADASHAWLAVHAPPYGWISLDPTNDLVVGRDHIMLAWGRDFGDVSPLRGVILGGSGHELAVNVSVVPVDPVS